MFLPAIVISCLIGLGSRAQDTSAAKQNRGIPASSSPFPIEFIQSEIESRSWLDGLGRRMEFLKLTTIPGSTNLEIAVVQYGLKESSKTYCVDIFKKYPMPAGFEQSYVMLAHDMKTNLVTKIDTTNQNGGITIQINRAMDALHTGELMDTSYDYFFDCTNGLRRSMSTFLSVTPPSNNAHGVLAK